MVSRKPISAALLAALWALNPWSPAGAQEGSFYGPPVDVTVAELAVAVEDSEGHAVLGLERQDFRLYLDGEEAEVQSFRPPGCTVGPSGPEPREAPLHWVVFVEPAFLEAGDLTEVLEALREVLQGELPAGTHVSLVGRGGSGGGGFTVMQGPTTSREDMIAALPLLESAPSSASFARTHGELVRSMERLLAEGRDSDTKDQDEAAKTILSRIRNHVAQVELEISAAASRLGNLVPLAAGLPGRPVILYVGGRFPTGSAGELLQTWRNAFGRYSAWDQERDGRGLGVSEPTVPEGSSEGSRAFRRVAEAAGKRGVTIHALDAGALRSSRGAGGGGLMDRAGGVTAGTNVDDSLLRRLAEETGGRAIVGSRAFRPALTEAAEELCQRYLLAVAPAGEEGSTRKVEVEIWQGGEERKDLTLRHRRRLELRSPDERAADGTVSALLLGGAANPLEVQVQPGEPRPAGRRNLLLPVTLRMPLANLALVAEGKDHVGRISVFTTAGGGSAGFQPVQKAVVPVRIANDELLTSMGRDVEYRVEVPMPKGADAVAVGVRDDFGPATSTLRIETAPAGTS